MTPSKPAPTLSPSISPTPSPKLSSSSNPQISSPSPRSPSPSLSPTPSPSPASQPQLQAKPSQAKPAPASVSPSILSSKATRRYAAPTQESATPFKNVLGAELNTFDFTVDNGIRKYLNSENECSYFAGFRVPDFFRTLRTSLIKFKGLEKEVSINSTWRICADISSGHFPTVRQRRCYQ